LVDLHQQQQQQQSPTSNQVVLDELSIDDTRRNIGDAALSDVGYRSRHATSVEQLPVVSNNINHARTNEMCRSISSFYLDMMIVGSSSSSNSNNTSTTTLKVKSIDWPRTR
jgi:hypothetical protein